MIHLPKTQSRRTSEEKQDERNYLRHSPRVRSCRLKERYEFWNYPVVVPNWPTTLYQRPSIHRLRGGIEEYQHVAIRLPRRRGRAPAQDFSPPTRSGVALGGVEAWVSERTSRRRDAITQN